ncbi:hypothetical protein [Nocardia sp. NPDC046763]|uniref:hypothetical protein n=1 Tax=Nocardia sp. NPDC046763 TaxID=3155256 RepID=UPI0033C6BC78
MIVHELVHRLQQLRGLVLLLTDGEGGFLEVQQPLPGVLVPGRRSGLQLARQRFDQLCRLLRLLLQAAQPRSTVSASMSPGATPG